MDLFECLQTCCKFSFIELITLGENYSKRYLNALPGADLSRCVDWHTGDFSRRSIIEEHINFLQKMVNQEAAENERKRKEAEEAARKKAEEDERRRKEAEEAERKRKEEEALLLLIL